MRWSTPLLALCAAGALAGLVFLGANLTARRAYLGALVDQLQAGSLDLSDIGGEIVRCVGRGSVYA